MLKERRLTGFPRSSHQQCDVGALPAAICVQFIEDEKLQSFRLPSPVHARLSE